MTENKNIESFQKLTEPNILKKKLPITPKINYLVNKTRQEIKDILNRKDPRKLCIVGPCSIHNIDEALIYGKLLKKIANQVKDKLLIVMRVYFEKPRTTIGWKGLINDPNIDNTFRVNYGLHLARRLLLDLNQIGIPCGCEFLDTITPHYICDLISWGAIGARTTESQVHRQLVSGLSMPVGFKNGTGGSIKLAADAILSAKYPHCFMGIQDTGRAAICHTRGNKDCHIILRGGSKGPNYFPQNIEETTKLLEKTGIPINIMVDCSHGNSGKDFRKQVTVMKSIKQQDNKNIIGIMMESNIYEGKQNSENKPLKYGISITDSCVGIINTKKYLLEFAE